VSWVFVVSSTQVKSYHFLYNTQRDLGSIILVAGTPSRLHSIYIHTLMFLYQKQSKRINGRVISIGVTGGSLIRGNGFSAAMIFGLWPKFRALLHVRSGIVVEF
jgi:hypothetical protein